MNIFQALGSLFRSVLLTAQRAETEREQMWPEGRKYDHDLKAQCDAYYLAHGTMDGFIYREPSEGKPAA